MNRNKKSKGAQTPSYPSNADEWRDAISKALYLTPEEGKARYQAGTFPFDNLVSWIRQEFNADEGYSPDFVPALVRNIKGLAAWVYGEGLEPYWPGHNEH